MRSYKVGARFRFEFDLQVSEGQGIPFDELCRLIGLIASIVQILAFLYQLFS